ncbi:MAG: adenine phosphoribosyltransferase [Clostridiales bacterium]|jgi:adenine phosphoribosyltransferase|nr:adenine phosphoribosyltransferase [Eubacteriales bacterium]MDH7565513.1 adenine phosphoribosyltransferase [Clostridiales bacterium]
MDIKSKLRHVMNFPTEGIDFIDITTVLQDAQALRESLDGMKKKIEEIGEFDLIVGPESRGFIFGAPLAYITGKGFVPIRKKGKLPYKTVSIEYQLEYGTDTLEIHEDAIKPGQKVIIVDDLLATGGTSQSNIKLVEMLGGQVAGLVYLVELTFLNGREKLKGFKVDSIVQF